MLFAHFDGKKAHVANYTQYESEQKNFERNSNHGLARLANGHSTFRCTSPLIFSFFHSLKTMRKCDSNHGNPMIFNDF